MNILPNDASTARQGIRRMQENNPAKHGIFVINGILPPPYGGIATYLSNILPILAQRSHKIFAVMGRDYSNTDYSQYEAQQVNVYIPSGTWRRDWRLALKLLYLVILYWPWLWRRCFHYKLPIKEALACLYKWFPECDKYLAEHRDEIDIIHVFDQPWTNGWVGEILAEKHQKKLIITTFGEVVPHRDDTKLIDDISFRYQRFCTELAVRCERFGSMNAYCASKLDFIGVSPQKVHLTTMITGMEHFIKTEKSQENLVNHYPILRGKRYLLFVGQMLERKGPHLLLRIAPEILAKYPDTMMVFVGPDHGLLEVLKNLAVSLTIDHKCLFTGRIPDAQLYLFYQSADLFVFPTISDVECLGLAFVQAMYAKCPVVASNISGVPEIIRHGENGLLFEPGNMDQMRECIYRVLDNPAFGSQLATQAYEVVVTQFTPELIIEQAESLYDF
jgi:glycosyltransferase involved in cell wall biosynthesis